jgi:hypothetical protein
MGNIDRPELPHSFFVQAQKPSTRRQIIVHDVKYLAIDVLRESRKRDCIRAVIHICERYCIRATEMQKHAKRVRPYATADRLVPGPVNVTWPNHDVRNTEFLPIFPDDFFLFHFSETVGFTAHLRVFFHGARFIQESSALFSPVRVNCERTDIHKPDQPTRLRPRLHQIASRDDRIHKGIGERFLTPAGGQVEDYGHILARGRTVFPAEEIAMGEFQARAVSANTKGLNPFWSSRRSDEATQVPEPVREQPANEPLPDEPGGPGH